MKFLRPLFWGFPLLLLTAAVFFLSGYFHAGKLSPAFPAEAEISPRTGIRPGDEVNLAFSASIPADRRILAARLRHGEKCFSSGPVRRECTRRRWDENSWRFSARLQALRSGESGETVVEVEIAPLVGGKKTEKFIVFVPEFTIHFPEGETEEAKLISADPVTPHAPASFSRWYFLLLLLIPLLWLLLRRFRRRKAEKGLSAWEKAEKELSLLEEALKTGKETPERSFSLLCDVVREYLERRFALPVSRRTTEEFLLSLAMTPLPLPEEEAHFLTDFLRAADLVKFAAFPAGQAEVAEALKKAHLLIRRTIPQEPEKRKETSHEL